MFLKKRFAPTTPLKVGLILRLCGFGVALSAEAEVGQFRTDRVCRSGYRHVEKSYPWWESNPQPQELGANALPSEPRQLMITKVIIAEFDRNAAMRFTANKNVALSASPIAA